MIKLQWYGLTKPHVVHRYYKIKEAPKYVYYYKGKPVTDVNGKPYTW